MPQSIQPSFSKGEIAPALYGRVDTAMYGVALRTARNLVIHTSGGASKRKGLRWLAPVRNHNYAPRLIDFQFKTTDKYVLEFGDLYMRVMRNDAHVTDTSTAITAVTQATPGVVTSASHGLSNGDEVFISGVVGMTQLNGNRYVVAGVTANTFQLLNQVTSANVNTAVFGAYVSGGTVARIYTITSPYAIADLAELKYVQNADVMTLVHKDYAPRELSRTGHSSWTFSTPTFAPSTSFPTGVVATEGTTGAGRARYRVTAIGTDESLPGVHTAGAATITGATAANPVVITAVGHGFETSDEVHIASITGMTELNGRRFIIDRIDANSFSLRGENGAAYTAYSAGGTATRTFVEVLNNNITGITQANPAVVTVGAGHGFVVNDLVKIAGVVGMTQVNNRSFVISAVAATTVTLSNVDSTGFTAYSSGGSLWKENTSNNVITWTAVTGATSYRVYKEKNGIYGFIGETQALTFTEDNIAPDTADGPPSHRNPFFGTDNQPGAVSFYEQRRVFGGTTNEPDTSFFSQPGSFNNMSVSSPVADDDAITATLSSLQVNEIRHYVPLNDLVTFTSGSEWRINSGPDSAFTPTTIKQRPGTYWGSGHRRPLVSGNTIIFAEDGDAVVRSLAYSFQYDSFTGSDLGLLAPHLLEEHTITDWAYSGSPDNRIHIVRSDGKALSITFDEEQQVVAWTRWDTLGDFEAVTALRRGGTETMDSVYFVVKRRINGETVRYIEKLDNLFFDDVQDAFFVDCGLTYDVPLAITAATAADPVQLTVVSHGLSNGDLIDISDIVWETEEDDTGDQVQPDQLNGNTYVVRNATTHTFTLEKDGADVDGSAFLAYVEGGFVRKQVLEVTGLDPLEGETIVALANGNVIDELEVSLGRVELPYRASRVHFGLRYLADLETLNIESGQGTIQGTRLKVNFVVIRFEKSRGIKVGPNVDNLVEMKQRTNEPYDTPTRLLTGDTDPIFLKPEWNSNGRVFLRQPYPLPMTVLAVIPNFEVGSREEND